MKEPLKFPDCVPTLHHALLRGCNLDPMRPTMSDEREWWEFMREMEPLEDTPEGPFGLDDLVNALAEIRKENDKRDRQYRVKLVPTKLLRDPAKFRDIVLELRRRARLRPRPPVRVEAKNLGNGVVTAIEVDPAADANAKPAHNALADVLQETVDTMRRK